jgi:hypothetical protein
MCENLMRYEGMCNYADQGIKFTEMTSFKLEETSGGCLNQATEDCKGVEERK